MKSKKAVSALIATVLITLITVSAVGIIWGAIVPMITQVLQLNQACLNARLTIDMNSGYSCYNESSKQAQIMVKRGPEDFKLYGVQLSVSGKGQQKTSTFKEDTSLKFYAGIDEGSGSLVNDLSGNKNDGAVINAPSWTEGKIEKSLNFGWGNNWVIVPNSNSLDITGNITITAWIKPSGVAGYERIAGKYKYTGVSTGSWVIFFDTTPRIICEIVGSEWLETAGAAPLNQWSFVACVFKSGVGGTLYLNTDTVSAAPYGPGVASSSYPVGIGMTTNGIVDDLNMFSGVIDEVQIFSRALSDEEIRRIYSEGLAGKRTLLGRMPNPNEANSYILTGANITQASVAPIVKIGDSEKTCSVTSEATLPKCLGS
jgi:hypothetical protein